MAQFKTYSSGLTIKQPLPGVTNFFSTMDTDTYQKISEHDHTGGGKGNQISAAAIAANAINGTGFRLVNNTWLRSRNAAGSGDLNLVSASTSDELRFANAGANTRADLGLAIGTNVQAYDADLTTLGGGGNSARAFLGLGTGDSPTFTNLSLSSGTLSSNTSDGSDSSQIYISGGGGQGTSRGAVLVVCGNEHGTTPGYAAISAGVVGSSTNLDLLNPNAASINLATSNTTRLSVNSSGNLIYAPSSFVLSANTSDGGDNKSISVCGGGAAGGTRGAFLTLTGNEHASAGEALLSGNTINVSGSTVNITSSGAISLTPGVSGTVDLHGTTGASAGVIAEYLTVSINGTNRKLACYAMS